MSENRWECCRPTQEGRPCRNTVYEPGAACWHHTRGPRSLTWGCISALDYLGVPLDATAEQCRTTLRADGRVSFTEDDIAAAMRVRQTRTVTR